MQDKDLQTPLARPYWDQAGETEFHRERLKDVTVLICQRKTRDLIQLCIASLLTHYPEVKILVVDGVDADVLDESTIYLRFMSKLYKNLEHWERIGRNSHGESMNEAIQQRITTPLFITMDSDIIIRRGGYIEGMMEQMRANPKMYATGSLMIQSIRGEACSPPEEPADELRYAHPSLSMFHTATYKTLKPFTDHGAPCAINMIDAHRKQLEVGSFPIANYVQHLCGASWQEVCTVWDDDGDTLVRPFITFIVSAQTNMKMLTTQTDHDFNIVTIGNYVQQKVGTYVRPFDVSNYLYDIRFRVSGHYVCMLNESITNLVPETVAQMKLAIIEAGAPEEITWGGLICKQRKAWQKSDSLT